MCVCATTLLDTHTQDCDVPQAVAVFEHRFAVVFRCAKVIASLVLNCLKYDFQQNLKSRMIDSNLCPRYLAPLSLQGDCSSRKKVRQWRTDGTQHNHNRNRNHITHPMKQANLQRCSTSSLYCLRPFVQVDLPQQPSKWTRLCAASSWLRLYVASLLVL
jgi:hypothetical protein